LGASFNKVALEGVWGTLGRRIRDPRLRLNLGERKRRGSASAAAPWPGDRRRRRKRPSVDETSIQEHGRQEELTANPTTPRARTRTARRRLSTQNGGEDVPVHIRRQLERELRREKKEETRRLRGTKTELGKGITGEKTCPIEFSTTAANSAALGAPTRDGEQGRKIEWGGGAVQARARRSPLQAETRGEGEIVGAGEECGSAVCSREKRGGRAGRQLGGERADRRARPVSG